MDDSDSDFPVETYERRSLLASLVLVNEAFDIIVLVPTEAASMTSDSAVSILPTSGLRLRYKAENARQSIRRAFLTPFSEVFPVFSISVVLYTQFSRLLPQASACDSLFLSRLWPSCLLQHLSSSTMSSCRSASPPRSPSSRSSAM